MPDWKSQLGGDKAFLRPRDSPLRLVSSRRSTRTFSQLPARAFFAAQPHCPRLQISVSFLVVVRSLAPVTCRDAGVVESEFVGLGPGVCVLKASQVID